MLDKQYLEQLDLSTLYMIAVDYFQLDLYQYKDEERPIDLDKLILDILEEQEKIVKKLPPGLLEEAEEKSKQIRQKVFVLNKDNQFKVLNQKEVWRSGHCILDEDHEFYDWTIILIVGEEEYDEWTITI